jgi:alpha-beta hydrolase superfamily lysophospholipase
MRYAIINPAKETVEYVERDEIQHAQEYAGLEPYRVDHGTIAVGVGIVVYEHGLLEPNEHYFIAGEQLFAGNAVVYQYNRQGETVSMTEKRMPEIKFLHGVAAVEKAIEDRLVTRPYVAINGVILQIWREGVLQTL